MNSLWGTRIIVALLIFAGAFSLFQASWLASKPGGAPKLVASGPVDVPRDGAGCVIQGGLARGAEQASPETLMLQTAVGFGADAIVIDGEMADGKAVLPRFFAGKCPSDASRPRAAQAEAMARLSKPDQFIRVNDAAHAKAVLASAPAVAGDKASGQARIFFGPEAATAAISDQAAFSIENAQACTSSYRVSGLWGGVSDICRGGTMLLELGDLGYTLWGWPDRFLARMKAANVRLIIVAGVEDGEIRGLTKLPQYSDIARSYNGYIWVDNIAELGPALKR
ncbi:MAG: hypothetical protein V3V15_00135 [Sphingorhabdus sp.]